MHPLLCILTILAYTILSTSQLLPPDFLDSGESNQNVSLLWGPFRSNLYLGVRARTRDSPLIGLMWSKGHEALSERTLRHVCEQNDEMKTYGWSMYDPRSGGTQNIKDVRNELDLDIDFIRSSAPQYDHSWASRVKSVPRPGAEDRLRSTAILYISLQGLEEDHDHQLDCFTVVDGANCAGHTPLIGSFHLSVQRAKSLLSGTHTSIALRSVLVPDETIWRAKSIYLEQNQNLDWSDKTPTSNLYFIEMQFEGAFKFDILLSSGTTQGSIRSANITRGMPLLHDAFSSRFQSVYQPQSPFNSDTYLNCSWTLLSNLLGGISYFYGDSRTDNSHTSEHEEVSADFWKDAETTINRATAEVTPTNPAELFTMVPSRPFFPRGFLWDEGFHLLVLVDWDLDLAVEILMSWFARMDEDGWIAREQILGAEARSKVPPEFQVQYNDHANPPTLFLAIAEILDLVTSKTIYQGHFSKYVQNSDEANKLMHTIFPLMKRHYYWFRRTQAGDMEYPKRGGKEGYRWRGRTSQHTLTSGLDDYPRAQPPHPGELHIDAASWVGAMARILADVGEFVGDAEAPIFIRGHQFNIERGFLREGIYWSKEDGAFCDATVDAANQHRLVCHKGYISIFPFALGLVGGSQIRDILDLLHNPEHLWTPFGIRSLSKQDPHYGTDENYWRRPIWININYLILKELSRIAHSESPSAGRARDIYTELRRNVVDTVCNSWRETGFAWEQYDPDTGRGQRTQHFTGWTALVVKIMAMPDLREGGADISAADPATDSGMQQPMKTFAGYHMSTELSSSRVLVGMMISIVFIFVLRRRRHWLSCKVRR